VVRILYHLLLLACAGCVSTGLPDFGHRSPQLSTLCVRVAAYCPCPLCCGPMACGKTASGRSAYRPGIAADWACFPAGTGVWVPGYGVGIVDDTGGALRRAWRERRELGMEVRFQDHDQARAWGVQWLEVRFLTED
jgi:3D (Asp-Asp-Asp) domain-containing protein